MSSFSHPLSQPLDYNTPGGGMSFGQANVLFRWNEVDLSQFDTGNVVTTAAQTVSYSYQGPSATELSPRVRATCTWVSAGGSYLPIAAASMANLATPTATHTRAVVFIRYALNDRDGGGADLHWIGFAQTNATFTTAGLYGYFGSVGAADALVQFGYAEGSIAAAPPFTLNAATGSFDQVGTVAAPAVGATAQHIFDTACTGGSNKPVARLEMARYGGLGNTPAVRAPDDALTLQLIGTDASWNGKTLPRMGLLVHRQANATTSEVEWADIVILKHWMDWA